MSKTNETIPTGGQLPIFYCQDKLKRLKNRQNEEEDAKKRQYKTHKTSVSIKQIMEQRKNVNPFIAI